MLKYKWEQLAEIILKRIDEGIYKIGSKLPSERELQEEFGVSRVCVRQMLDKLEAKNIITRLPGKGAFVGTLADIPATERPKSGLIALTVLGAPTDPPTLEIVQGIRDVMVKKDYHLIIEWVKDDPDYERKVVNKLLARGVDGLILTATARRKPSGELVTNREFYLALSRRHIPFVVFDRFVVGEKWSTVSYQVFEPTLEVLRRLNNMGRKKIAYIGIGFSLAGVERYESYMQALKLLDLEIDQDTILLADNPDDFNPVKWAKQAARTLLSITTDFDAIMCFSPLIGYVAYKELVKQGKQFPDGKCIGSFEWTPIGDSDFQKVFIGTEPRPLSEMGKRSAELLFNEIESPETTVYVQERVPIRVMDEVDFSFHNIDGLLIPANKWEFKLV